MSLKFGEQKCNEKQRWTMQIHLQTCNELNM